MVSNEERMIQRMDELLDAVKASRSTGGTLSTTRAVVVATQSSPRLPLVSPKKSQKRKADVAVGRRLRRRPLESVDTNRGWYDDDF